MRRDAPCRGRREQGSGGPHLHPGRALWHSESVKSRTGALLLAVAVLLAAACDRPSPDEEHVRRVLAERAAKDEFLRSAEDSPMPAAARDAYLPLAYYDVNLDYAVPAQLVPAAERTRVFMATSTGRIREMERVGALEFLLDGRPLRLSAFVDAGTTRITRLFVPFTDLTSGTETYAGGRYMDLDPTATGIYVVDFNRAYHPYCYFNPEYDCPFPPPENRLDVPIRAGERLPDSEAALSDR